MVEQCDCVPLLTARSKAIHIPSRADGVSLTTSARVSGKVFTVFIAVCMPPTLWNTALAVLINNGSI